MLHYCNPGPRSSLFTVPELNWKICTWQMNKDLHQGSLSDPLIDSNILNTSLWLARYTPILRASHWPKLFTCAPLIGQAGLTWWWGEAPCYQASHYPGSCDLLSRTFISTRHCVTRMLAKLFLTLPVTFISSQLTLKGRAKSYHLLHTTYNVCQRARAVDGEKYTHFADDNGTRNLGNELF